MNVALSRCIGTTWTINRKNLLNTLQEAREQADKRQQAILASYTQIIEWHDPLCIFTALRRADAGACFFWEKPADQSALVGAGVAATIETSGSERFSNSAKAWQTMLNHAIIRHDISDTGPVLFGGFTFDPLSQRTSLWSNFPDGLLILPEILFRYTGHQVTLTINRVVRDADDIEQWAIDIENRLKLLREAIYPIHDMPDSPLQIRDIQPAAEWMEQVKRLVEQIEQGAFEKVVLAREIEVKRKDSSTPFDISTTLSRLRENYPGAYVFALQRGKQFFAGATPERLAQANDGQVHTMALAGSAPRGETEQEDERIGTELLASGKNNQEHAIVVAMVREALKQYCANVYEEGTAQLLKLKNVQHLKTPLRGELLPGHCLLDIIAALHPTPAVGGFPQQVALEAIRLVEQFERGWYAAPLGWLDAHGNGEFAVALRSGLIDGDTARLFAGCGIVAGSDPQAEFAESCLKFQVMLRALGNWN